MAAISELPTWFDRNPKNIIKGYSQTVGPHTHVHRWVYTVPAGRMAFVESAILWIFRDSATTTDGDVNNWIALTVKGGQPEVGLLGIRLASKDRGAYVSEVIGQAMILLAGDKIEGITADENDDGTINYHNTIKVTEFDAITAIDRELIMEPAKPDIQAPWQKPWWWPY